MLDPPNPPPVIRAPSAPAARAASTDDVELGAAHLVVVAQRGVRGVEEPADLGQVAGPQGGDGLAHPADLGDDVARASAEDVLRQAREGLVEPGRLDVAQGRHPQLGGGPLGSRAALRVLAVVERVRGSGVGDEEDVAGARPRPAGCRGPPGRGPPDAVARGCRVPPRSNGTCSVAPLRQSRRRAWSTRHSSAADWSMPPVGHRPRRSRRGRRPARAWPGRRRRRAGRGRRGRWPPRRPRTPAPRSSTARRPPAPRCRR